MPSPVVAAPDELEEQLMALGYLDHAESEGDAGSRGVVHLDRARTSPWHALSWLPKPCLAELIDIAGRVIHSWNLAGCRKLNRAILLPNGHLVMVGGSVLAEYSWEGEELWAARKLRANHDVVHGPDGSFLTLKVEFLELPEWSEHPVRDDVVLRVDAAGKLVDRVSLWSATSVNDIGFELLERKPKARSTPRSARKPSRGPKDDPAEEEADRDAASEQFIDLFHSNKIEWMSRPELVGRHPLYALGNVLVTCRNQNTVLVIDFERGKLIWAWGQGELSGPHDATILDNGNLLIFDNGLSGKQSRVLEVDPPSGEIIWEYDGADRSFFSAARGAVQRLPNGNTLVVVSGEGHAREVTPGGEIVWEYWNPHFDNKGRRVAIGRMQRYPADFLDADVLEAPHGARAPSEALSDP